jgi:hypothetical protein
VKWVIIAFVLLPPYVGVANFVGRFTGAVVVVFLLTVVWRAFMLVVQPAVPDFDMSGHARQIGRWIGRRL